MTRVEVFIVNFLAREGTVLILTVNLVFTACPFG
jgi:hypothetical protein